MSDNISAFDSHEYNAKTENPLCWLDVGCGTGRMADEVFGNIAVKRFVF